MSNLVGFYGGILSNSSYANPLEAFALMDQFKKIRASMAPLAALGFIEISPGYQVVPVNATDSQILTYLLSLYRHLCRQQSSQWKRKRDLQHLDRRQQHHSQTHLHSCDRFGFDGDR